MGQRDTNQTVVVAGVTGAIGHAAASRFVAEGWKVIGLSRRAPLRPVPEGEGRFVHVPLDLTDADACHRAAAAMADATHLVFAALFEKPGLIPGWREPDQMETNRLMLVNLLDGMGAGGNQTGLRHISLLQGTKAYGAHVEPMLVPGRERDPRHEHENFYWLQEDELRDRQAGAPWTSTILRPQVVYGEALGGNMNALPALGVYAALCRAAGEPLHYPGGVAPLSEAVDADLVARLLHWSATNSQVGQAAANETFNITNGDVYTLRNCWPAIAAAFGMEVGDDRPLRLAREMPPREHEWAALVDRFDLVAPRSFDTFVGQSFIYADLISGHGQSELRPPTLVSTIKVRQAGFARCVDTEDMFGRLIDGFQRDGYFPPRDW